MRAMNPPTTFQEPTATPFAMRETKPTVFLISRPSIDLAMVRAYLQAFGGTSWLERRLADGDEPLNDAQLLVEFCGRGCYRSWEPGLNPNVTRIREDQHDYLGNLLSSLHGSVLEHANYTFAFRNVSRVFTRSEERRVGKECRSRWSPYH